MHGCEFGVENGRPTAERVGERGREGESYKKEREGLENASGLYLRKEI